MNDKDNLFCPDCGLERIDCECDHLLPPGTGVAAMVVLGMVIVVVVVVVAILGK